MIEPLQRLIAEGFSETILKRFWAKVNKTESCWLWTGSNNGRSGHGKTARKDGSHFYVHRLSWILHNGPIPDGLRVCHNCPGGDNPKCVNPAHLFLGTQKDNIQDASRKGTVHKGYKLGDDEVLEILKLRPTTSGKELAKRFGVSMVLISQIVHGHRYPKLHAEYTKGLPSALTDQRKNLANYR